MERAACSSWVPALRGCAASAGMRAGGGSRSCSSSRPKRSAEPGPTQPARGAPPVSRELPRWIDVGLIPAVNILLAFLVAGAVVTGRRREPARRPVGAGHRRLRLRRGDRLHPVLRDQPGIHRPGGRRGLPCRAVQHRRRGPGLYRRARGRAGRARARRLASGLGADPGGDRRRRAVRRRLGVPAGLAAGAPRQPRRHHHHHVQLPGLGPDGAPDGQRADPAGPDVAGEPGVRAHGLAAVRARDAGRRRDPGRPLAAQPVDPVGGAGLRVRLAADLPDPLGLCDPHGRPQRAGGGVCRHRPEARRGRHHVHLRRARRLRRHQRDPRGAPPAAAELHRRLRLHRHRRGADGPGPPGRHRAGQPAVRRVVPGLAPSSTSSSTTSPATWWW